MADGNGTRRVRQSDPHPEPLPFDPDFADALATLFKDERAMWQARVAELEDTLLQRVTQERQQAEAALEQERQRADVAIGQVRSLHANVLRLSTDLRRLAELTAKLHDHNGRR